jgi:hypothetical protein
MNRRQAIKATLAAATTAAICGADRLAAGAAGGRGGRQGAPAPTTTPIHYKVTGCYFAQNRRLAGTGTGARLECQDIDPSFLDLAGTTDSDQPISLERDQTKRSYLHPVVGSEAAKIGSGLFTK